MTRGSRIYYFRLAERLGKTVKQLLNEIDAHELAEWMAYDMTQDEDWVNDFKAKNMSDEQRSAEMRKLFGF